MSDVVIQATPEQLELLEQAEPLMTNTRKQSPVRLNQNCIDESDDEITSSPVSTTPRCPPATAQTGAGPSPSHTAELLAGGIPKNRKRPGSTGDGQRVTMLGTVTRGNGVGQPVEVQLELTENEFLRLTSQKEETKKTRSCVCQKKEGLHIVLWGFLCIPVALLVSLCVSFYNGSMTWYNLIIYFSEEKSLPYRVTLCPLIILSFPFTVGFSALCIAVVACVMQISWSWLRWQAEFFDGEKGFYGWFCSKVGLPKCSPYEVVVLDDTTT